MYVRTYAYTRAVRTYVEYNTHTSMGTAYGWPRTPHACPCRRMRHASKANKTIIMPRACAGVWKSSRSSQHFPDESSRLLSPAAPCLSLSLSLLSPAAGRPAIFDLPTAPCACARATKRRSGDAGQCVCVHCIFALHCTHACAQA